jgi:hypothetical protein
VLCGLARAQRRYTAAHVSPLLGQTLGSSSTLVFLTLVAVFWAIFTHMAAELVGVPSQFRSALLSTLLGWGAAEVTCVLLSYALVPSIVAGAIGSYFGMRIFYRAPPLRSLVLFAVSTLVTVAVFGGIVAYMTMQRSRIQ